MKRVTGSFGIGLVICIATMACEISGVVTPTPGMPPVQEVATIATIAFNAPVTAVVQVSPVEKVTSAATSAPSAPAGMGTPTPTVKPNKTELLC